MLVVEMENSIELGDRRKVEERDRERGRERERKREREEGIM